MMSTCFWLWNKTYTGYTFQPVLLFLSFKLRGTDTHRCENLFSPFFVWRLIIQFSSSQLRIFGSSGIFRHFDVGHRMPKRQFCSMTWNMRGNHRLVNYPTGTRAQKLAARNSIKCTLAARPGICSKPQTPLKRDFTRRQTVRGSPVVTGCLKAPRRRWLFRLFGKVKEGTKGKLI